MKRFSKLLGFSAVLCFLLSACQSATPPNGPQSASNADAAAPNSEKSVPAAAVPKVSTLQFEGDACVPAQASGRLSASSCQEGLVCVPEQRDLAHGVCRVDCGELASDGESWKKTGSCPAGRTCQLLSTLEADTLGAFCLPQQMMRDGDCSSPSDDQACGNGRLCAVSEVSKDKSGKPQAASFVCRDQCPFGQPSADASCSLGERCVSYDFEAQLQRGADNSPVICSEQPCAKGDAKCECDLAAGFHCKAFIPGVIAVCERSSGICANPIRMASAKDLAGSRFSGQTCNIVSKHDFCDQSQLAGLRDPAQVSCLTIDAKSNSGLCFGLCQLPSIDEDGDGKISDKEAGQTLQCPTGFECRKDLARLLGMAKPLKDLKDPKKLRLCDPTRCEANQPCPDQCGVGDAECMKVDLPSGKAAHICGAPYGSCEQL